ncbi:MAG: exodeoxyribonuclease VII large subunit [Oscillospiraceae bacterium]|jgi:exodeoxyribonuclease VII large subunit|nr:exodeoxyribonuclease VII large subunit [Oscillospiraceae bacterium]
MEQILTVSQVNGRLKKLLDGDLHLKSIFVRGEISNFTHHLKTGHFYFTLKDEKNALKGIMFKWNAEGLRFMPQNGMSVIAFGSVQLYERDGVCQLYCVDMQPDGVGALYAAFEQLKGKLAAEGLFDPAHKRSLPPFPGRIGVITAKTGAALQDIIQILGRRYPLGELLLIPALVQGDGAPESLCEALRQGAVLAEKGFIDLLIIGRGGGSLEDLWAFNDERVARAVYHFPVPVISAVGHETDYTICDFAADLRAPTPSAAAELAAPDCGALADEVSAIKAALSRAVETKLGLLGQRVGLLSGRLAAVSPKRVLEQAEKRQAELARRLPKALAASLRQRELLLQKAAAGLEALSPLKVLARGYSITYKNGEIVRDVKALQPGDQLQTYFADGTAESQVTALHSSKKRRK